MSWCFKPAGYGVLSILLLSSSLLTAQSKPLLCDDFDNGTVQDAGNGQTSYWRPSGKVTEFESKLTLHAIDRPYSKTAISSPLEKRVSFFKQPVAISITGISIQTSPGINPKQTQIRFGFRDRNNWTFRNTVDALMVNIVGDGRVIVAWKVGKKQHDPENGNRLIFKNLDMTHGPVTAVEFAVDGTGDTIAWSLAINQSDHLTELAGVIGEMDTKTIREGWNAKGHKAVITTEVQGRLGDDFKDKFVLLNVDQCCISTADTAADNTTAK